MLGKLNEWSVKALIWFGILFWPLLIILALVSPLLEADELAHVFKSPSFSGANTSSHYLTIENQERTRREAIKDDVESALQQAERDAENTTMAKFMRNLESRIYAQLSKQLVESLFRTCEDGDTTCTTDTYGSFMLEGNLVTYEQTACDSSQWACTQGEDVIVMTIVDSDGTETVIVIPIGAGSGSP